MLASWYQNQLQNTPFGTHGGRSQTRSQESPPNDANGGTGRAGGGGAFTTMRTFIEGASGPQPAPRDRDREREKEKKTTVEPVFGPNIGLVSGGPSWAQSTEKKVLRDELTSDILKGWIEKSKDASQPTTTLQALVNLKRPTLRLSPLAPPETSEDSNPDLGHPHQHGLEFEYDCDAPQCGIYVHILLPPDHPEAGYTAPAIASSDSPYSSPPKPRMAKVLVYESVVEGGFGKVLRIADGAVLELERYEPEMPAATTAEASPSAKVDSTPTIAEEPSEGSGTGGATTPNSNRHTRRRFTKLHFRKRTHTHNRSVSGPALAVVDAEPAAADHTSDTASTTTTPAAEDAGGAAKKSKSKDELEGVRVAIRLAALDAQGAELAAPNEQITYLHVVRFGAKPEKTEGEVDGELEDVRPWVVKVVKREATIGPHTFQLHEIFGLTTTASSSHTPAPTAALPATTSSDPENPDQHTYPPPASPPQPTLAAAPAVTITPVDDDMQSECLLCLSSPREVVLLPCRHLVACKECAVNMVEFGAGGNITQNEEPVPAAGEGADTQDGANGGETTPAVTPAPAPAPTTTRRKRKAKGWFCPVCRQPYTSLLRITTTPPPVPATPPADVAAAAGSATPTTGATPAPAGGADSDGGAPARTGFALRPSFLRGLSRSSSRAADVEAPVADARA
ncbi:hypothetical protein HGRIS_011642 [Hohenbuehelia grisea]|uniref:RING-type domain-containing protein n=1 Tax=Hohenbuehelia grisea TaxID=104357 RepID=A0ABR3JVR9_9AGAR